jgi:hypothetical protein
MSTWGDDDSCWGPQILIGRKVRRLFCVLQTREELLQVILENGDQQKEAGSPMFLPRLWGIKGEGEGGCPVS